MGFNPCPNCGNHLTQLDKSCRDCGQIVYNDGLTPQDLKRLRLLTIIVKIIGSIFIAGFFIAVLIIMFIGDS